MTCFHSTTLRLWLLSSLHGFFFIRVLRACGTLGGSWIEQEEVRVAQYAQKRFSENKNVVLLGRQGRWSASEAEG
jgi:hypothetical protein